MELGWRASKIDGETIAGDAVVIAMGSWSILAGAWLPMPAVYGLKGHSLVFATGAAVSAEALFLEYREGVGQVLTPELFPMPRRHDRCLRHLEREPAADRPGRGQPGPWRDRAPGAYVQHPVARADEGANPGPAGLLSASHKRRNTLIGRIRGIGGAYVATGHSVWGILNAPATGEAMAELITEGRTQSIDLAAFDLSRLPPRPVPSAPRHKELSEVIRLLETSRRSALDSSTSITPQRSPARLPVHIRLPVDSDESRLRDPEMMSPEFAR
jgi:glycine/D-amino acid oxidase-like deaminating enzyme